MDMSRERSIYKRLRAGPQSMTPTTDRRKREAAGTSCSESRAKPDMSAIRLKTLEALLPQSDPEKQRAFVQGDPDKLRAWRLSQMLALGFAVTE
jgi:hypothetical protein